MSKVVDYYFAIVSPYMYLGHDRFVALAAQHGATIRVKPINLGEVFPVSGGVPLAKVANVEKMLPRDYITKDGYGITAKARAYLAPLIRGESPPPYKDGLPRYVRLKNVAVPKKLATSFNI